jgi:hypothetical protein
MSDPRLLVENFFSPTQFPDNVVDANEEDTNKEAWRVGTARRSVQDAWLPTTLNNAAWLRVDRGASDSADMVAIDRGHNLQGEVVTLQKSTDNFVADTTQVFQSTIPSSVSDDTALTAINGALTPEGAWVKAFTSDSSRYWRLLIAAMGAGLRPRVVNLWLGLSYAPSKLQIPWGDDDDELLYDVTEIAATGWRGTSPPVQRRRGELRFKLRAAADYATTVLHLRDNFNLGRPMWIVYEDTRAERAVLGERERGRQGFSLEGDWGHRQSIVSWVEREPRVET